MTGHKALVSQLDATLKPGLGRRQAERVLNELQDIMLMPNGLYLAGGAAKGGDVSGFCAEIAGTVTRANGGDLSERDRQKIGLWLAMAPQLVEFSLGPLRPAQGGRE